MAIKVWLLPIEDAPQQNKQSAFTRDLLRAICIREDLALSEEELNLAGLDLIQVFSRKHGRALSIAHCEKMLAVAIGPGRVGVDCEAAGRARNWQGMSRSFFTEQEAKVICDTPQAQRESVFLRHWVLKEAYLKAIHGSIFGDLNRLFIDAGGRPTLSDGDGLPWEFWELEYGANMIALCGIGGDAAEFLLLSSVSAFADGSDVGKAQVCSSGQCRIEIPHA